MPSYNRSWYTAHKYGKNRKIRKLEITTVTWTKPKKCDMMTIIDLVNLKLKRNLRQVNVKHCRADSIIYNIANMHKVKAITIHLPAIKKKQNMTVSSVFCISVYMCRFSKNKLKKYTDLRLNCIVDSVKFMWNFYLLLIKIYNKFPNSQCFPSLYMTIWVISMSCRRMALFRFFYIIVQLQIDKIGVQSNKSRR